MMKEKNLKPLTGMRKWMEIIFVTALIIFVFMASMGALEQGNILLALVLAGFGIVMIVGLRHELKYGYIESKKETEDEPNPFLDPNRSSYPGNVCNPFDD